MGSNGSGTKGGYSLGTGEDSRVFKEINKQTGLDFVYSAMQLNEIGMVSLDVKDVTVDVALKKLFEGKPFTYKFEMKSIIIRKVEAVTTGKTSRTIRGVITDKGE